MNLENINRRLFTVIEINEPLVISNNVSVILSFYSLLNEEKPVILLFKNYTSYKFGSPNDECLSGHELYSRGIEPYKITKFTSSPWLEEIIKINKVHPYFNMGRFKDLSHFVFPLKDRTFECICKEVILYDKESNESDYGSFFKNVNGVVQLLTLE